MEKLNKTTVGNVVSKFGFATPQEATWKCEKCGEVQPVWMPSINRYRRGLCACQHAANEKRQEEFRMARLKALELERLRYTYGWLGPRWSDEGLAQKTFANFDVLRQPKAYEATLAFADIMQGTFILYGSYGTGKTHLLAALCQEMKTRETKCRFTTAPKLFAAIQYRIGSSEDYTSLVQQAINAPLLVIDDIDKAKHTDFREEIYFEIIDSRVVAGRPIAISTNKLDSLASYVGGACASRLQVGQIAIEMSGKDYREGL